MHDVTDDVARIVKASKVGFKSEKKPVPFLAFIILLSLIIILEFQISNGWVHLLSQHTSTGVCRILENQFRNTVRYEAMSRNNEDQIRVEHQHVRSLSLEQRIFT